MKECFTQSHCRFAFDLQKVSRTFATISVYKYNKVLCI